jgi:signal transduction histidine kinase
VHALVTSISVLTSVLLVALGLAALRRYVSRRDSASGWLVLAFATLTVIVTLGRLVPAHPHGVGWEVAQRLDIEMLVLFPYLLYRFATAFVPTSRRLRVAVTTLTVGLTVWTFALRHIPSAGEHRSPAFQAYVAVFLVHWSVLSVAVTARLWAAGRPQPAIARSRMGLLSVASATLTLAIVGLAFSSGGHSWSDLVVQLLGLFAAIAFLLAIEPPAMLRTQWRQQEYEQLQGAVRNLMTLATTRREIAERVVAPAAAVVGARGAQLLDAEGTVLYAVGESGGAGEVRVEQPNATLVAWTSPYAPFFGEEEIRLLETITSLTGIALDRVRLFEQEHEARVALERANELMANFVALAAHELRTPVTIIHGLVQTLNHLSGRLPEEQKENLRVTLEQQTARMASLVEQLLDLSRLDANAIEVRPQPVELASRVREVVRVAAGDRAEEIVVDLPSTEVTVDPDVLDHIVTNLVTNALRYGGAPVRVSAVATDGHVRLAVEDSGPGVARELEATLFDRFTRAGVARDRVAGTGLGLAIARAYAQAHRGELVYERAQPCGARFVLVLPTV